MRQRFSRKLKSRLAYDSAFQFAIGAAGLAAFVHWLWLVSSFIVFSRQIDAATMVIIDWDPSVLIMHIRIGLALLLATAALLSRRLIGLFASAVALVWVCLEYLTWYKWSSRIKEYADIQEFPSSIPQAFDLYGGNGWNAAVLVLVVVVLSWEIRRTVSYVRLPEDESSGSVGS